MFPGACVYVSQIDRPLPSSFHAPSIWYDDVATPQKNPGGNVRPVDAWPAGLLACCGWPAGAFDAEQLAAAAAIDADTASSANSRREMDFGMAVTSLREAFALSFLCVQLGVDRGNEVLPRLTRRSVGWLFGRAVEHDDQPARAIDVKRLAVDSTAFERAIV